jgi:hypothetical protein
VKCGSQRRLTSILSRKGSPTRTSTVEPRRWWTCGSSLGIAERTIEWRATESRNGSPWRMSLFHDGDSPRQLCGLPVGHAAMTPPNRWPANALGRSRMDAPTAAPSRPRARLCRAATRLAGHTLHGGEAHIVRASARTGPCERASPEYAHLAPRREATPTRNSPIPELSTSQVDPANAHL